MPLSHHLLNGLIPQDTRTICRLGHKVLYCKFVIWGNKDKNYFMYFLIYEKILLQLTVHGALKCLILYLSDKTFNTLHIMPIRITEIIFWVLRLNESGGFHVTDTGRGILLIWSSNQGSYFNVKRI